MSLIKRSNQYMIKATKYIAEVDDKNGIRTAVGYEPKGVTADNPLGEDEGLLMALARIEKQKRDEQAKRQQNEQNRATNKQEETNDLPYDPEMVGLNNSLPTSPEESLGFGSQKEDPEMTKQIYKLTEDLLPSLDVKVEESNVNDLTTKNINNIVQGIKRKFGGGLK